MPGLRKSEHFELDLGRYELRRDGRRIRLERKPMELLIFLVSRREQMVSREEIRARLWRSDLFVDAEPNINNIVRKIRAALCDDADRPRFLETVVGKGYRFVGPVRVIAGRHSAAEGGAENPASAERERQAALAVLPLVVLGNTKDEQGLSLGFADALVATLGNLAGVDVLPLPAVINAPLDGTAAEKASRLGVRFVVHGAMQKSKGIWRLSAELYDAHLQRSCFVKKYDVDASRLAEIEQELARQVATRLNRPGGAALSPRAPRYSRDPMAYAEFMSGYRLSSPGDSTHVETATQHLTNAVTRDPGFALAHAELSLVCAKRHFEFDPASVWLEKAEFHGRRALELDPDLPEGHVAKAYLLWGHSKNFQHLEAIAELKKALRLQNNLPHAYDRLGTILAHIGLLDAAEAMFKRGGAFHPRRAVSHSIVQVYLWRGDLEAAREEIEAWRAENPSNKYPIYWAPQEAMMAREYQRADALLQEAEEILPDDSMIASLRGVFEVLTGRKEKALEGMAKACAKPGSFGHAHHTAYQIACILALLERKQEAFGWFERSIATGFACWPFFRKDPCLANLREERQFESVISVLQGKYPEELGTL